MQSTHCKARRKFCQIRLVSVGLLEARDKSAAAGPTCCLAQDTGAPSQMTHESSASQLSTQLLRCLPLYLLLRQGVHALLNRVELLKQGLKFSLGELERQNLQFDTTEECRSFHMRHKGFVRSAGIVSPCSLLTVPVAGYLGGAKFRRGVQHRVRSLRWTGQLTQRRGHQYQNGTTVMCSAK